MQTTRLGISQKVFAQLERIFRRTGSHEADISPECSSRTPSLPAASVYIAKLQIDTRTSDNLAGAFLHSTVHHLSSGDLAPSIHDIGTWTGPPTVHCEPTPDTLATFSTNLAVRLTTGTPSREIHCQAAPSIIKSQTVPLQPLSGSPPTRSPIVHFHNVKIYHSRQIPGIIPVVRFPMDQRFLPKAELRICWRKAVLKTKRNPQELKMLGFFPGIPLSVIKKIEFTPDPVMLRYWLVDNPRKEPKTTALSLFHSLPDDLFFLTSSQDE